VTWRITLAPPAGLPRNRGSRNVLAFSTLAPVVCEIQRTRRQKIT
jgi:hypothetical protein